MKKDLIQVALQKYIYNSTAKEIALGIKSYKGKKQDTFIPVTIKIIDSASNQLYQYLYKLKNVKSDYVAKIYELIKTQLKIMVVFQENIYGTLGTAISKCKRLQDSDFIYISKIILNGQVNLLRSGIHWIGDENDIQIGENGIKLSWNGASILSKYKNPFPQIFNRLTYRENFIGLLPFPKNKLIQEIIQLANQNATVISSHDMMKKREIPFKKKGKGWLAIRQSKNKNQYYEQIIYLAISQTHGFIRVKYNQSGQIEKGMIQLNKQKSNFTKIIEYYEESGSMVYISEYSNDGNLFQYVAKLKNAGISLNEDQIQFFFYSLIQPLKQIQKSPLLSINTINIKNIFIQSGIPKIGQPLPISNFIQKKFKQRAEVPDFYHPKFKAAPFTHNPSYDTYSLGILLYKLMYTEYPIFPQSKVHIPTSPSYKKRTISTVELFLNEGGRLVDIQQKISVSQEVKKQIQQINNRKKIEENNKKNMKKTQRMEATSRHNFQIQILNQSNVKQEQSIVVQKKQIKTCWNYLFDPIVQDGQKVQSSMFIDSQYSDKRSYRICLNLLIMVCIYILVFYMFYLKNLFNLFISSTGFHSIVIQINSADYTINVMDDEKFFESYQNTIILDLQGFHQSLNCAVDNSSNNFTKYINNLSPGWIIYLIFSFLFFISFIILKISQGTIYDAATAISKYQLKKRNFNISRYIILNLTFGLALYSHYFMFNYIFHAQYEPCFGGNQYEWYSSTFRLFYDRSSLLTIVIPTMLGILLYYLAIIQLSVSGKVKIYNRVFNPITVFIPPYIVLTMLMRLGVLNDFKPSWLNYSIIKEQFSNGNYIAIFGIIPEILIVSQNLLALLIDIIFWKIFIIKKGIANVNDQSSVEIRSNQISKQIAF